MNPHNHIRYLRRQQLDIARWDACIDRSRNGLIYGRSWYLDAMADGQWDGLVLNDYDAVMPLCWRRKAGIRYLYQPPFTQQTGIFSPQIITPPQVAAFLETVQTHFRFAEIFLNFGNLHHSLTRHANFILPLDAPYATLAGNYKGDLVRNLRLAERSRLTYSPGPGLDPVLDGYRHEYAARTPHVLPSDYTHFGDLCHFLQANDQVILRAVTSLEGKIVATALLLRDRFRLYLLQSTTFPEGRRLEANHYLLDRLVREWAGSGLILDFEGSDLPGVAHFYKNFGGIDQPYYFYRYNRLPWPLRSIKDRGFTNKLKHGS
jgi:hypothetical protein